MPAEATVRLLRRPSVLRVVRGAPTAEELAALLVVIAARAAAAPELDQQRSAWGDPARRLRSPVTPHCGGAWRSSAQPG